MFHMLTAAASTCTGGSTSGALACTPLGAGNVVSDELGVGAAEHKCLRAGKASTTTYEPEMCVSAAAILCVVLLETISIMVQGSCEHLFMSTAME